jgi:maltose alpha-D-glucosyltransferase/alpha-amylase
MVQEEMLNVVRFWLGMGIDGFRVDAPTYLFEREGTNCESLPETHAYLKRIRSMMDDEFPGAIMLAESNQWPRELIQYFDRGDEFHMAFHFPLMPRIYLSLAQGDRTSIQNILNDTPVIPAACQWTTFLRNHDELTLEMVTDEERQLMWREYAPESKMILNLGIRRRLAPMMGNDRRKIELANSLLFTLPGSPILYYGDEIGMGDNLNLPDRNGVRTPMQWDESDHGGFTSGTPFTEMVQGDFDYRHVNVSSQLKDPNSLFQVIKKMVVLRKKHAAFGGSLQWLETGNRAGAVYVRQLDGDTVLIINNLSGFPQEFAIPAEYRRTALDLFTGKSFSLSASLKAQPYSYLWLQL